MLRIKMFALRVVVFGGIFIAGPVAAQSLAAPGHGTLKSDAVQLAASGASQTAALPAGTIRLRVINRVGGPTLRDPIDWRVETYGRDAAGKRLVVAELTDATPELVLPAGWYIVHARVGKAKLKHPVEVTAGRTFKYTLVRD